MLRTVVFHEGLNPSKISVDMLFWARSEALEGIKRALSAIFLH